MLVSEGTSGSSSYEVTFVLKYMGTLVFALLSSIPITGYCQSGDE